MEKRHSFGGSIGFVLAAAGSAVGLGNIWRFPYLAAKDGGGIFLFIYIILAFSFGFALLTTEVAIGRKTKQSPLTAYTQIKKGWKFLGVIGCLVPAIIMPYYCAIGGWVIKYFIVYITNQGNVAAEDGYFTGFITQTWQPIVYMLIFLAMCSFVIFRGVNKGIEKLSKIIMPALIVLVIVISIFSLTISYTDGGVTRTGLQGLVKYVIPDFKHQTVGSILSTTVDAMGQLFFSLSVAMGIMIAYGSYVSDDANLGKSVTRIELFDTLIAFLAGVMIIPAVFVFMGSDGMSASGPSLMFISLPKVFSMMGVAGKIVGALFFAMTLFAAVTSGVSVMEAVVSSIMDEFKVSRFIATVIETIIAGVVGVIVCLGYNQFYFEVKLPNGAVAQILDILDFISNNLLMPIVALGTCILVGWIVKPQEIISELTKNGEKYKFAKYYTILIKFVAPVCILIILLRSCGIINIG